MTFGTRTRALMVAGTCAAVGAAGGIVGSMAAPSKHSKAATKRAANRPFMRHAGMRGPGGGPVHEEAVVLDKAGKSFITVTEDSGKVKSTSGNDVTITEGTGSVTYKDVTVTVPSGATIMRNGNSASVGDLKAGDFVHVSQSSDGTFVFAADPSWRPPFGRHPGDGDHHGFGPPPGAGGPPPGAPAPPTP